MILIPEQISDLRKQRQKLMEKIKTYDDYIKNKEIMDTDRNIGFVTGDSLTDGHFHKDRDSLHEIDYILSEAFYLKERTTDHIEIGTKFIVEFDNQPQTKTVILTECIYGLAANNNFVSIESLLGKNVLGKKEGDTFSYVVITGKNPKDQRKISGHIVEIKTSPKEYLSFIRDTEKYDRTARSEKNKLHQLLQSETEEEIEELKSYQTITLSQKDLLENEKNRLLKNRGSNSSRRLTEIKKLLKKPVVEEIPFETIGIGSTFEIAIAEKGKEPKIESYEMINYAVSDELEDAYLERISPLGSRLYGLKVNDTFKVRRGTKTYFGVVTNINLPENKKSENKKTSQYVKK